MTRAKGRRTDDRDEVWRRLIAFVMAFHEDWRRRAAAATDLPLGRMKALRPLLQGPRTLRELAYAVGADAPATTVLVNDLEKRGLVVRAPHPTNRRAKLVSLTPTGRATMNRALRLLEIPPPVFQAVDPVDLAAFARVLDLLSPAVS